MISEQGLIKIKEAARRGVETGKRKAERKKEEYNKNPNLCKECNSPILCKENNILHPIKKKVFCCRSCAAKYNNRGLYRNGLGGDRQGTKNLFCMNCDKILKVKQKKYCCHSCQKEYQGKEFINKWLCGEMIWEKEYLSKTIRDYLIEASNNKCSLCGWSEKNSFNNRVPLHIDHIDGNAKNCYPSNLQVLCPNCHSLTKTFGSLNYGNGRAGRRDRYIKMSG